MALVRRVRHSPWRSWSSVPWFLDWSGNGCSTPNWSPVLGELRHDPAEAETWPSCHQADARADTRHRRERVAGCAGYSAEGEGRVAVPAVPAILNPSSLWALTYISPKESPQPTLSIPLPSTAGTCPRCPWLTTPRGKAIPSDRNTPNGGRDGSRPSPPKSSPELSATAPIGEGGSGDFPTGYGSDAPIGPAALTPLDSGRPNRSRELPNRIRNPSPTGYGNSPTGYGNSPTSHEISP